VNIFFKNRIIIDQLKHQEKVTPSLHKLCKYYNRVKVFTIRDNRCYKVHNKYICYFSKVNEKFINIPLLLAISLKL